VTKRPTMDAHVPAGKLASIISQADIAAIQGRYEYSAETREIIDTENLLPAALLSRLHSNYPQHSGLLEARPLLFRGRHQYAGLQGLRAVIGILEENGIHIGHIAERELFAEVYRFLATRHVLNSINWAEYEQDSIFQLVIPQPGMLRREVVDAHASAGSDEERRRVISEYMAKTNPHDGNQLLNKPWMETEDGLEIVTGSQHKYPQCQLIFDRTTQSCFAFCTYCFRHAQVRGDHDMFVQDDIPQVHRYLREHPEVTDVLITGGDGGYMPIDRLREYVTPILEEAALRHVRTIRLASRALTYHPEMILTREYDEYLEFFQAIVDSGVQLAWMAHFSSPRELLNPSTIAAIRRLQRNGAVIRSQSPIMNHISLFTDDQGKVDVERSAQNWIDLGNILTTLRVGFHSMYCARPTGEHHYFTAPLADIVKVFSRIYRSLPSISRPSRYISMTTSAGKVSLLGTVEVGGETAFALKFTQSRDMEWMDKVFLARYDETTSSVTTLQPFDTPEFFFERGLQEIEDTLAAVHHQPRACDD
jgi:lysine 2,3-aminomutase